jgi:Protein kinase domain
VARGYLGTLWLARDPSQPENGPMLVRRVAPLVAASTRAAVLESARWAAVDGAVPVEVIESRNAIDLATPLVDAEPLRSLLRTAASKHVAADTKVLLGIAADVLRQLDAIHQRAIREKSPYGFGAVHPDSILVGLDGRISLLDVGVGAAASAREPFRGDPQRIGYAAPEQMEVRGVIDAKTDVFAVGVILWEALSNRRLFPGNDAKAARERLQKATVLRLDATRPSSAPGVATDIAEVVARALDRNREARFATAAEMAAAITPLGPAGAEQIGKWVASLSEAAISKRRVLLDRASLLPPPGRPSLLSGRASIPPGRLSVPPGRASIPPGRLSVPPGRASIPPGRSSVRPELPRRASVPPAARRPSAPTHAESADAASSKGELTEDEAKAPIAKSEPAEPPLATDPVAVAGDGGAEPLASPEPDEAPDSDPDALEVLDGDLDGKSDSDLDAGVRRSDPGNAPSIPSKRLPPLPLSSSLPPAPSQGRADDSVLGSENSEPSGPVRANQTATLTARPSTRPRLPLVATAAAFIIGIAAGGWFLRRSQHRLDATPREPAALVPRQSVAPTKEESQPPMPAPGVPDPTPAATDGVNPLPAAAAPPLAGPDAPSAEAQTAPAPLHGSDTSRAPSGTTAPSSAAAEKASVRHPPHSHSAPNSGYKPGGI